MQSDAAMVLYYIGLLQRCSVPFNDLGICGSFGL